MARPITLERERLVPLTWSLGPGGTVDRFVIRLFEVVIRNDLPELAGVEQWITLGAQRRIDIDPELFVAGKRYVITVEANLGLPGAADGDMMTIQYPYAIASFPSPMFEISN